MQRIQSWVRETAGISGAVGDDGGFLEATLAGLAAPAELAAAAAPRIPAHNLRILAQVAARDPMLLMAIGTTKEARGPACQGLSWTLTDSAMNPDKLFCSRTSFHLRHKFVQGSGICLGRCTLVVTILVAIGTTKEALFALPCSCRP